MNILYIALLISLASLGFRAITDKGMILYFLRKPFDKLSERKTDLEAELDKRFKNLAPFDGVHLYDTMKVNIMKIILYIMKPFILCSTCMASVHTLVWWFVMGFEWNYNVVLVMLIVATLNTLIWSLIQLIKKHS